MRKQTARRGVHLHPAKRNLDRKTLWEMKRVENISSVKLYCFKVVFLAYTN